MLCWTLSASTSPGSGGPRAPAEPGGDRLGGRRSGTGRPSRAPRRCSGGCRTAPRPARSGPRRPGRPCRRSRRRRTGKIERLARRPRRATSARLAHFEQPGGPFLGRSSSPACAVKELLQVAADHQADDGVVADARAAQFAGVPAVAQHDDAVGDRLRPPPGGARCTRRPRRPLQVADHLEQPVGFALGQAGGRLVHDQHARLQRQGAGDLDELLLPDRQVADRVSRRARPGPARPVIASAVRVDGGIDAAQRARAVGSRPRNRLPATSRFSARFSSW